MLFVRVFSFFSLGRQEALRQHPAYEFDTLNRLSRHVSHPVDLATRWQRVCSGSRVGQACSPGRAGHRTIGGRAANPILRVFSCWVVPRQRKWQKRRLGLRIPLRCFCCRNSYVLEQKCSETQNWCDNVVILAAVCFFFHISEASLRPTVPSDALSDRSGLERQAERQNGA